jgi:hypothetical protein
MMTQFSRFHANNDDTLHGWMTQSIHMVAASILVEYLRVNWTKGCEWFHYTLMDADTAINAMMWQNEGKSRIDQWNCMLLPSTASQDPSRDYTRCGCRTCQSSPTQTWFIDHGRLCLQLKKADVVLGETYPHPIVEDLQAEQQKSINATLPMRQKHQEANSDRGCDMITLPNSDLTVVSTKKEYGIDSNGSLTNERSPSGQGQ